MPFAGWQRKRGRAGAASLPPAFPDTEEAGEGEAERKATEWKGKSRWKSVRNSRRIMMRFTGWCGRPLRRRSTGTGMSRIWWRPCGKAGPLCPPLSLVAVEDGRVVGHILFTEIRIGDKTDLALAPLSVLPAYQRQGIGQALMARGHAEAARLGYGFSVVLGSPAYYSRAGYVPAARYGIRSPFDVPDEYFMALDLQGNSPDREGTVEYAPEFFSV